MSLTVILLIAIGLSMDAFSLAIIYGTLNLKKKMCKLMSIMVGIFHFFMPILGYILGKLVLNIIKINPEILTGMIFIILAIEMFLSLKKEEKLISLTSLPAVCIFALTVSLDSFSIGIGLCAVSTNIFLACLFFSIISGLFTYLGVNIGKKLSTKFGNVATLFGTIILFLLGISYLV